MDKHKSVIREEFEKVLEHVEELNTHDEKLKYLKEVALKYVSLLESPTVKLLDWGEFYEIIKGLDSIRSASDGIEKGLRKYLLKKDPDNYIPWKGELPILRKLIEKLIKEERIYDYSIKDIDTIMNQHFYWNGCDLTKEDDFIRIRWNESKPLLKYLFKRLIEKNYVDKKFILHIVEKLDTHFGKPEGGPFPNLYKDLYQAKELSDVPKQSYIIDDIVENLKDDI